MSDKLQHDIDLLRAELAKIENTAGLEKHVQALNTAIDRLQEDAGLGQSGELNEQLDEMVTNFEIDNPVIHGLLRNLVKTLGDLGI